MGSENISEVESEVAQPGEAVAADTEVKLDEPQSGEEETELFIEEEAEQIETAKDNTMNEGQLKAAYLEKNRKFKKERKAKDELQLRMDKLEKDNLELRQNQAIAARGEEPDILNYSSTAEFREAEAKWKGGDSAEASKQAEPSQKVELSEDQSWHLHKSEEAIKSSFKDYGEVVSKAEEALKGAGVVNMDGAMNDIAQICHEIDIDPAKVKYALGTFPEEAAKLIQAVNTNPSARNTVLRKLEGKVKTRSRKKITSEPEPKNNSTGAVNVGSEAEKKAMNDYVESGHAIEKYKVLQKIRKANKA